jgi:hypothetical protein
VGKVVQSRRKFTTLGQQSSLRSAKRRRNLAAAVRDTGEIASLRSQ